MWNSLGQDDAIQMFAAAKSENRLAHSYLFFGPDRIGKATLAEDFARLLFCEDETSPCGDCLPCKRVTSKIHTDVNWIEVGGEGDVGFSKSKSIGIDRIREIRNTINIKPFEGSQRLVVILGSEDMTLEASNALLKVLEEPPPNVFFLLLTANLSMILPTIISRCQMVKIKKVSDEFVKRYLIEKYQFEDSYALNIARLASGKIGMAIFIADNPDYLHSRLEIFARIHKLLNAGLEERFGYSERLARDFPRDPEKVHNELRMWEIWWRDFMLVQFDNSDKAYTSSNVEDFLELASFVEIDDVINILKTIDRSIKLLQRNVNPRLVLDQLVLETPVITKK